MTIFWIIIELLASVFEFSVIICLLNQTASCRFAGNKKLLANFAVIIILTAYISIVNIFFVFEGWLSIITILITIIYSFIVLKSSAVFKIIIPIIAYSLMLIINVVVTYALSLIFGRADTFIFTENNGARLIALFLTKLLFFFSIKFAGKILKKENINFISIESFISVIMSVLTFIVAIALVKIQIKNNNEDMLIFICILCILLMDIFIIYMVKKLSEDAKDKMQISMLELQLNEQKTLIEDASSISTEIRKAEHDLKHHLLSVLGIIEDGNLSEAQKYLKDLLHEYETSIFKYISIDNSAINSIINLKIGRCHSENIDIKLEIQSDFSGFNDVDICVLLANLFDNAIEASAKVNSPYISVAIRNEKNYLCIMVKNKIDGSVIEKNIFLKTTKSDKTNHGLGLYSISQIVDKYDGIKSYYENNGCFIADIWLKRDTNYIL